MQFGQETGELSQELKERIDNIVKSDKIVLFMKGTKDAPRCGFSDAVVKALNFHGVNFETYDILAEPDLRTGMKVYSEWATFPQLYINSEFIGGCDIVMDLHQSGELKTMLEKV